MRGSKVQGRKVGGRRFARSQKQFWHRFGSNGGCFRWMKRVLVLLREGDGGTRRSSRARAPFWREPLRMSELGSAQRKIWGAVGGMRGLGPGFRCGGGVERNRGGYQRVEDDVGKSGGWRRKLGERGKAEFPRPAGCVSRFPGLPVSSQRGTRSGDAGGGVRWKAASLVSIDSGDAGASFSFLFLNVSASSTEAERRKPATLWDPARR